MAQICLTTLAVFTILVVTQGVYAKRDRQIYHIDVSPSLRMTQAVGALWALEYPSHGKGGCSAFGHSCFGGHGKRSGDTGNIDVPEQQEMVTGRRQSGQEETPPHPGYPRTNYNGILPTGDDIIPVRDGGVYDHDENAMKELMKFRLRNIMKHWMDNYRRSQQSSDEGYYMDAL